MPGYFDYPFDSSSLFRNRHRIRGDLGGRCTRSLKLHVLSGSTVGELSEFIGLFLLNFGIDATITSGGYNAFYEEAMFGDEIRTARPDWVYVHTGLRNIRDFPKVTDGADRVAELVDQETARLIEVADRLTADGFKVILNNIDRPLLRETGNLSALTPNGALAYVRRLNDRLLDYIAGKPSVFLNDIDYLSSVVGLDRWTDWNYWHAFKYAVAPAALPWIAASVAAVAAAAEGAAKKALVCDLDNTLWGGVIGDDGADGIALGPGSPKGEAYADVQGYLGRLGERGVALAVNSKNDPELAVSGFAHRNSEIALDRLAAFVANWEPKSANMGAIAESLNLGTDSFVFLEDNPAEVEEVGRAFPEIVPVSYTSSPVEMIVALDRLGYFEPVSLSQEDVNRSAYYRENRQRDHLRQSAGSLENYLKSLEMTAVLSILSNADKVRAVQLVNKTNQFNPTTRRTDPDSLEARLRQPSTIALAADLKDRFGDNGTVSILLAEVDGQTATIDTWVMSCRVFNRTLECAVLDRLAAECRLRGVTGIEAWYTPTAKNGYVTELYDRLGFELIKTEGGTKYYRLDLRADRQPLNTLIEVLDDRL